MDEFNWAIKAANKWAADENAQIWRLERMPDGNWEVKGQVEEVLKSGRFVCRWLSYNLGPAQL